MIVKNISKSSLRAAVILLQDAVEDLTPTMLVEALKNYRPAGVREEPKTYTRKEVASILGVTTATVDRYLTIGLLQKIAVGPRIIRISPGSVQSLIKNEGSDTDSAKAV